MLVSQAPALRLPPLTECSHHVNLTNGIELIPVLDQLGLPYRRVARDVLTPAYAFFALSFACFNDACLSSS